MARVDPRAPVVIGVAQVCNRDPVEDASPSPLELLAQAARAAIQDSGASEPGCVIRAIGSVRVTHIYSWRYADPGRLLAEQIGARNTGRSMTTTLGGSSPQFLLNRTCADIQRGDLDVALVGGSEAWRTRMRLLAQGREPQWPKVGPTSGEAPEVIGWDLRLDAEPLERARGLTAPIETYPIFESALRAAAGATHEEWRAHLGRLWGRFATVAATNPDAWRPHMGDRAALAIPTVDNRMIGFPYPKALNSNNSVDQASALIVASASAARALGVPLDRQVFVHAGTDGNDAPTMTTRPDLVSSPAIRIAGRRALDLAHLGPGEIEYVDLYSCFPSAVQIAARELGLSLERELTVTGGMSFAGAPWSSYTMHAVASMVALLRGDPTTTGLISANGGFLAKHSFGVYAARPPAAGFTHDVPQQQIDASYTARRPGGEYVGPARIEGYTVMHDRDGAPAVGLLALDVNGSSRTWGTTRRPEALLALESEEGVGRTVDLLAGGEAILSA